MAGSAFFALLDDIATLLDDVAALSKVTASKTVGVLGDDLALNAEQVSGLNADRELPVVWAVAKGSARNKVIMVPAALLISAVSLGLVKALLLVGGLYLCFEGAEKVLHALLHRVEDKARHDELIAAMTDPAQDLLAFERDKIRGAIRTDLILSGEIIVITLGLVAEAPLVTRLGVLVAISAAMTVGVYGLVAAIVKLDDFGLHLHRHRVRPLRPLGAMVVAASPWLLRGLSVLGTVAMFLVGGGILLHAIPPLQHAVEGAGGGPFLQAVLPSLVAGILGFAVGLALALLWSQVERRRARKA